MKSTFRSHTFSVLSAVLIAASAQAEQTEDAKLESFFKAYLDQRFQLRPMFATEMGDHRFDSQLEDLSAQARKKWLEHTHKTLSALPKAIDYQKLSRASQVDYEILQHSLAADEWLTENFHPFEPDLDRWRAR